MVVEAEADLVRATRVRRRPRLGRSPPEHGGAGGRGRHAADRAGLVPVQAVLAVVDELEEAAAGAGAGAGGDDGRGEGRQVGLAGVDGRLGVGLVVVVLWVSEGVFWMERSGCKCPDATMSGDRHGVDDLRLRSGTT